jgi:cytoskeleton protein RodZ
MTDILGNSLPDQFLVAESDLLKKTNVAVGHSAGGMLLAARQERNLTIQQVAEQLKLSPRQIVALEEDQFEKLPKMVIIRGFVRAYSKLLKIDADSVVALLPKDVDNGGLENALKPALSTPFMESQLSLMGRQNNNHRYLFGAALLAVCAIIFFIAQKSNFLEPVKTWLSWSQANTPEVVAAPGAVNHNIGSSAVAVAVGERDEPSIVNRINSDSSPVALGVGGNQELADVVSGLGTKLNSGQVLANSRSTNIISSPSAAQVGDVLTFKFRQDSWIQIKDGSGNVITSHLAKGGSEESFPVNDLLRVRLGNAAVVDGILRGQPIEILADKGSNVANLSVK